MEVAFDFVDKQRKCKGSSHRKLSCRYMVGLLIISGIYPLSLRGNFVYLVFWFRLNVGFLWQVKLVKCIVQNMVVDISFNQLGGLSTLCFLEQVNFLVTN